MIRQRDMHVQVRLMDAVGFPGFQADQRVVLQGLKGADLRDGAEEDVIQVEARPVGAVGAAILADKADPRARPPMEMHTRTVAVLRCPR